MKIRDIDFEGTSAADFWNKYENKAVSVITAHQEMVFSALTSEKYQKEFEKADVITADGVGLLWALRFLGKRVKKCSGIDLINVLIKNGSKKKIYLFGAKPVVVEEAAKNLSKKGLNIVGTSEGYNYQEEEVIRGIKSKGAEMVLVGMGGTSKQLELVNRIKNELEITAITVGGSIDLAAGKFKRAPKFVTKIGFEWLYRMLQDPKKITKIPKMAGFVFLTLKEKIGA